MKNIRFRFFSVFDNNIFPLCDFQFLDIEDFLTSSEFPASFFPTGKKEKILKGKQKHIITLFIFLTKINMEKT